MPKNASSLSPPSSILSLMSSSPRHSEQQNSDEPPKESGGGAVARVYARSPRGRSGRRRRRPTYMSRGGHQARWRRRTLLADPFHLRSLAFLLGHRESLASHPRWRRCDLSTEDAGFSENAKGGTGIFGASYYERNNGARRKELQSSECSP